MKQCAWCRRTQDIHTGEWENGPAIMLQEASGSICPDCEKKLREEYLKSRQRRESNDTGDVKKEIL